ncbi:hypothetical protein [Candidatus Poriferisodalis sp.]|uniref:hypothetical protein n=1 Tax=Candidatus Poriferisodalis sp. TaxID=3101277 RepID=UPI003D135643
MKLLGAGRQAHGHHHLRSDASGGFSDHPPEVAEAFTLILDVRQVEALARSGPIGNLIVCCRAGGVQALSGCRAG